MTSKQLYSRCCLSGIHDTSGANETNNYVCNACGEATEVTDTQTSERTPEPKSELVQSPSETQLTLQEKIEEIVEEYNDNPVHTTYQILALFTQALTSLKSEMEGMKKDSDVSDYWNGLNLGISECQRVIDGMMK